MKRLIWTYEELGDFCASLCHLYHGGIPFGDALALMAEDETELRRRERLAALSREMDEGSALSAALERSGEFPHYLCALIRVGEQVGRGEEALGALAGYYEGRARLERQLRSALAYPAALLGVLLAVVVILLVWVLPLFDEVYARLGSGLTGVAGGLMALGAVLRRGLPVLCGVLALGAAAGAVLWNSPAVRSALSARWDRLRKGRGVGGRIDAARFARALSMAVSSGLSPREAVALAGELCGGSSPFRARCEACLSRLEEGCSLSEALREAGLFSAAQCRLLEAGARSGRAELALEQLAARMTEESETALADAVGRVEPALVVALALVVGAILLSVMLPLMHVMNAIG